MNKNERAVLRALYLRGKKISTPPKYNFMVYSLSEILSEAGVDRDDVISFIEKSDYFHHDREAIRLSEAGLVYCQLEFEKRKLGFNLD